MLFVPILHTTFTLLYWGLVLIFQEVSIVILYILFVSILHTFWTEIIAYFIQFSTSPSELSPSEEHSVHLENYPTSLLWHSSEILYTPLRISFTFQITPSSDIDPISIAYIAAWHIPDAIEETSNHQFVLIKYQLQ